MLFNSFHFLIFFAIVFCAYWLLPHKHRPLLLLVSSYYFYFCYKPIYLLLLIFTTLMCFLTGVFIEKYRSKAKIILTLNLLLCFGLLFYFKYLNFAIEIFFDTIKFFNFTSLPQSPYLNIILPIGISFLTFQNVGYAIDVYRKKCKAKKNFLQFALFSSYFPQLVAGPIERYDNLMPQLEKEHHFDYKQAVSAMIMIMIGFIKKVAVADTIAIFVDNVYNNLPGHSSLGILLATFLFAIQIYCDFSGYSDMAVGFSRLLGIDLMANFKSPYLSKSITEFWRRWHISLSTWFKDYLYIPLGGNRVNFGRYLCNLFITFLVSGLWHGANLTFVVWGAYHGLLLCIESIIKKFTKNKEIKYTLPSSIKMIFTFLLVTIGWVFFRANTISDAVYVFKNMFSSISFTYSYFASELVAMGFDLITLISIVGLVIILILIDYFNTKCPIDQLIMKQKPIVRRGLYILGCWVVLLCMMFTSAAQNFIYFQF